MNSRAINPVKMSFVNFVKCFTNTDPWNAATTSDTTINQIPTHTRHAKKSMPLPCEKRNIKIQILFSWKENLNRKEKFWDYSGVFLLRQIWIVKYYVKSTLKNSHYWKHKNWCFQKNGLFWHLNSHFVLKTTETPAFTFSLLLTY